VSAECYVNGERLLTNIAVIIGRHLTSSKCVWKWRILLRFISISLGLRVINKNISTSALTRAERAEINELEVVVAEPQSRANKSIVWQYFGGLYKSAGDGNRMVVDNDRMYCR